MLLYYPFLQLIFSITYIIRNVVFSFHPTQSITGSRQIKNFHADRGPSILTKTPLATTTSTVFLTFDDSNASTTSDKRNGRRKRPSKRPSKHEKKHRGHVQSPNEIETWRVYGVDVDPDDLGYDCFNGKRRKKHLSNATPIPPEREYLSGPVLSSLVSRLRIKSVLNKDTQQQQSLQNIQNVASNGVLHDKNSCVALPPMVKDARVVRRSVDARQRRGNSPKYTYVIDIDVAKKNARDLRLVHQPGRMELMSYKQTKENKEEIENLNQIDDDRMKLQDEDESNQSSPKIKPKIIIVGAGPAGLFCALSLASSGLFTPIILERGQPVEMRGKSIGALIHRRSIDSESNFSFGEGGAGTWSDGKLTTRIGRNSDAVRYVLQTLVKYGAPSKILVEGAPHLGTDNLVRLLRNMREDLKGMGAEFHFGTCAKKFHVEDGVVKGVDAECVGGTTRGANGIISFRDFDSVVLSTGHSARDVYEELDKSGIQLEPKGFAVGFRIEHPQRIINEIQYGKDWGSRVITERVSTDSINTDHFSKYRNNDSPRHNGTLPVASYRLATNSAFDGEQNRGAYSFCMCPGGQIVPSSTQNDELCINGMSFSNRDSQWANSALVVTVSADDPCLEKYRKTHNKLAGLEFQRDVERKASILGGGNMTVPVQRLTDFVEGKISTTIPSSSYRLGVKSAACHELYPAPLYNALVDAITHHFDEKQMPGFLCEEALLHGVETRTSSPVRIARDSTLLHAFGADNLYPSGEGAGFAGGIVSAAVDGLFVAEAIKSKVLDCASNEVFGADQLHVGFNY